jgi:predicted DNA-binding transcriptional regulator AlpA
MLVVSRDMHPWLRISARQMTTEMHMQEQPNYLTAKRVAARYGISSMTRYRWEHHPTLSFPKPLIINGRKFWSLPALEQWERRRLDAHQQNRIPV